MAWRFTDDVEVYAESASELLARNPVEHTVALSVIESVRAGHRWSEHGQVLFGCFDDGEVRGAVSLTPPFELLLAVVPGDTVAALVAALRREDARFPGVHGVTETVERFVVAWTSATRLRPVPVRQMRLSRLGTLRRPAAAPRGRSRPAGSDDLDTAVRWLREFESEAGVPATDVESAMRRGIEDGRVWLWEEEAQATVALASRTPTVIGVARIAPVYTPPRRASSRLRSRGDSRVHPGRARTRCRAGRAVHRPRQSDLQLDLPADRLCARAGLPRRPLRRRRGVVEAPNGPRLLRRQLAEEVRRQVAAAQQRRLRLVRLSSHINGGTPQYAGVYAAGIGGHAPYVTDRWEPFIAKHKELSGQRLRLVAVET